MRVVGSEGEDDHYPWKIYVNQLTGRAPHTTAPNRHGRVELSRTTSVGESTIAGSVLLARGRQEPGLRPIS